MIVKFEEGNNFDIASLPVRREVHVTESRRIRSFAVPTAQRITICH